MLPDLGAVPTAAGKMPEPYRLDCPPACMLRCTAKGYLRQGAKLSWTRCKASWTGYRLSAAVAGDSPPGGKENGAPHQPDSRGATSETGGAAESNGAPQFSGVRSMRRERSEGLAALLDSPDLPTGRAGPYALRRQLGPRPMSNREPSLAHLAASNSADLGAVGHAMAHERDPKAPKQAQPTQADANSSQGVAEGSAQTQQQSFAGFAPTSSSNQKAATSRDGSVQAGGLVSPFSQPLPSGMDPMDAFAHLPEGLRIQLQAPSSDNMSRTNSMVYNQVTHASSPSDNQCAKTGITCS